MRIREYFDDAVTKICIEKADSSFNALVNLRNRGCLKLLKNIKEVS